MKQIFSATAVAAAALAAASFAPSVHAAGGSVGFETNLVVNGDAEAGPGVASDVKAIAVPGWNVNGGIDVVQYGASGGFPDDKSVGPSDRGKNFFYGGVNTPHSSAVQTINLKSIKSDIAAGGVTYTFSGYLGGYSNQRDYTVVSATFESSTGAVLKHVSLGPVTVAERKDGTELLPRSAAGVVPGKATSVIVSVVITRFDGGDDDGYADNISLVLHKKSQ